MVKGCLDFCVYLCVLMNSVWSCRGVKCCAVYTGFNASLLKSHFNQTWTQQISQPALFLFTLDTDSAWNEIPTLYNA